MLSSGQPISSTLSTHNFCCMLIILIRGEEGEHYCDDRIHLRSMTVRSEPQRFEEVIPDLTPPRRSTVCSTVRSFSGFALPEAEIAYRRRESFGSQLLKVSPEVINDFRFHSTWEDKALEKHTWGNDNIASVLSRCARCAVTHVPTVVIFPCFSILLKVPYHFALKLMKYAPLVNDGFSSLTTVTS